MCPRHSVTCPNFSPQVNIYAPRCFPTFRRVPMHNLVRKPSAVAAVCALFVVLACAGSAQAQLGGLGGLKDKLKKKTPDLMGEKQPITTSLPDARWGDSSKPAPPSTLVEGLAPELDA